MSLHSLKEPIAIISRSRPGGSPPRIRLSQASRRTLCASSRVLAALDAEREVVRAAINSGDLGRESLARFDRVASARGTGIARAENQQCTGCSMGVRPQTWNQLREGELLSCDSCNRLLYWDAALQPAPKAPQPEVLPGTGRAPRKPRQAGA